MWQTYPLNFGYMFHKKTNNRVTPEQKYDPRIAGKILREYLDNSNEPLAVAYREHVAKSEEEDIDDQLFVNLFPNTELSVDLKLLTRKPGRLSEGESVDGSLVYDGNQHFTFREFAQKRIKVEVKRTPIVFRGRFINIHVKEDGSYYPAFNRPSFNKDLTYQDFFRGAAKELLYFANLIEKKSARM